MPISPENRLRYPTDWKLRSRFVREVRARNRCEWCGAANGQPHPVTGSLVAAMDKPGYVCGYDT